MGGISSDQRDFFRRPRRLRKRKTAHHGHVARQVLGSGLKPSKNWAITVRNKESIRMMLWLDIKSVTHEIYIYTIHIWIYDYITIYITIRIPYTSWYMFFLCVQILWVSWLLNMGYPVRYSLSSIMDANPSKFSNFVSTGWFYTCIESILIWSWIHIPIYHDIPLFIYSLILYNITIQRHVLIIVYHDIPLVILTNTIRYCHSHVIY